MKKLLFFTAAITLFVIGGGCQNSPSQKTEEKNSPIEVESQQFRARTTTTTSQLISPDGQWLLSVRQTGAPPIVHESELYLELINLLSKPNRYIHLDWGSPAGDYGWEQLSPLGWSSDGKTVYVSSFRRLKEVIDDPGAHFFPDFWEPVGTIFSIDLDHDTPFYGGKESMRDVMDFLPSTGQGLRYEKSTIKGGKKELFLFSATSSTYRLPIFSLPATDVGEVTSAALAGRDDVVYVVHRPGMNDKVYYHDSHQGLTKRIEIRQWNKDRLLEYGIQAPYRILIMKANYIRTGDAWMVVADKRGKNVVIWENDPFWCVTEALEKELGERCH